MYLLFSLEYLSNCEGPLWQFLAIGKTNVNQFVHFVNNVPYIFPSSFSFSATDSATISLLVSSCGSGALCSPQLIVIRKPQKTITRFHQRIPKTCLAQPHQPTDFLESPRIRLMTPPEDAPLLTRRSQLSSYGFAQLTLRISVLCQLATNEPGQRIHPCRLHKHPAIPRRSPV